MEIVYKIGRILRKPVENASQVAVQGQSQNIQTLRTGICDWVMIP